jgi:8-oxo-dGTP pyrophosphatase MutT (NUDIX family)
MRGLNRIRPNFHLDRTHVPRTMARMHLPERLAERLAERERRELVNGDATACAVLVPMMPQDGGYSIVYTLRSQHLPNHKGQVAFPGGKHSASEDRSLLETALREAHEEIEISPPDVQILGKLNDVYTMATEYLITPYVGLLPPDYNFHANPGEVDDVFTVSLPDLLDPGYHATEQRAWRGENHEIGIITAGRHKIWGATHTITTDLIDCLENIGACDK